MEYLAKLTRSEGVYLVSFPDFPNINTFGETRDQALKNAEEALNSIIESDIKRGFDIPTPKVYNGKGFYPIAVENDIHT